MWGWLFLAPVGGLVNRVRGGLFGDLIRKVYPGYGVQTARALFGLATAGFACLLAPELASRSGYGQPWVFPPALWLAVAIHLGLVLGWSGAADIGRDRDRSRLVEGLIMTSRGLLMTSPAGAMLWGLGYGPWFIPAGAVLGLLYELGHRTPVNRPGFHQGMEVAEVYAGVWLWLALALVVA